MMVQYLIIMIYKHNYCLKIVQISTIYPRFTVSFVSDKMWSFKEYIISKQRN